MRGGEREREKRKGGQTNQHIQIPEAFCTEDVLLLLSESPCTFVAWDGQKNRVTCTLYCIFACTLHDNTTNLDTYRSIYLS